MSSDRASRVIAPGGRIGVVGGGQLGRMFAATAARLGYAVHVLSPEPHPPAAAFAAKVIRAGYDDLDAVRQLAAGVDVVTLEFENVSAEALLEAERLVPVRPGPEVLRQTQDRGREKAFLAAKGLPHAASVHLPAGGDLDGAIAKVGLPCVVKSAGLGYDGKGQVLVDSAAGLGRAARLAGERDVVVEAFVELALELSVIGARGAGGKVACYQPILNGHLDHILDLSVAPESWSPSAWPAGLGPPPRRETAALAREVATAVFEGLELVGLACVEFFLSREGELLVNEIAPRTHNSGHLTMEAARTSQFEQQLRAVCGLPLGDPTLIRPAAMANLLGDLWRPGPPDWRAALGVPGVNLHLYGKTEARPGRKMGHLTATAATAVQAKAAVIAARTALTPAAALPE